MAALNNTRQRLAMCGHGLAKDEYLIRRLQSFTCVLGVIRSSVRVAENYCFAPSDSFILSNFFFSLLYSALLAFSFCLSYISLPPNSDQMTSTLIIRHSERIRNLLAPIHWRDHDQ